MKSNPVTKAQLSRRIDAAQGRVECDLLIRSARFLDVFTCEWREGDVAVIDGVIVGIEPGLCARRTIEAQGKWLVPGFIDAHVHVESSLLVPRYFEQVVMARGTTTAICDPHELANVKGVEGIRYFLDSAGAMNLDLWVMLSSCVPATSMETNGGGIIGARDLAGLMDHPRALGLAEMMNMPGVLHSDPAVLEKIELFMGKPVDGHCPLLRGQALSAYAAAGISSCHESSQLEEAREKLIKGINVWIREGSVAKDLQALAPLLSMATSTSIGFCTDDRNPLDIADEGHLDHLIRGSIELGVAPEVAYRAASWSVARHYGLAQGAVRVGAVAPGFGADLVLLGDARTCAVEQVFKRGIPVNELSAQTARMRALDGGDFTGTVRAHVPSAEELRAPQGRVHVIGVLPGKIITERHVLAHDAPGVARLTVLERYGKGIKPANAYVMGFGTGFRGAIASSVGHDSHNLIVVGDNPENMRVALAALIESGGGFCVVKDGQVASRLALPLGGLMSAAQPAEVRTSILELKTASRSIGCELNEPFLQLAFLSLPVIPSLKLTDQGLVDVDQFKIVSVAAG